jgi:signal transduction histidine kinase
VRLDRRVWDVDGDGRAEVVSTSGTPDGFHWRLDVLDAATGARRWSADLPAGSDDRGDGNWDGYFRAMGPFTAHLPDGAQPALLVGIEAGYDERPRGVLALDARDGRELWRYLTGAKPIALNFHIVDLDGDGRQEICLLGAGVTNLEEGEDVDGFRDDHARLFVVGDDGALRWQRALGAAPASGWVEPVDLDADGRNELVVAAWLTELGSEALFVLDGDGAVLASAPLAARAQSLVVTGGGGGAGATAWLSFDGAVQRYTVSLTAITAGPRAVTDGSVQVALVGDVVGDAALEVLLGGDAGWNWLVDETLNPLALLRDSDFRPMSDGTYLRAMPGGERRLVVLGGRGLESAEFAFEPVEPTVPWTLIVAGVAVAGAAWAGWRWWRDHRKLTPAAVRALRMQVMERLEMAGHARVGSLSAVASLLRFVGSYESGLIDLATLRERTRDLGPRLVGAEMPNLAAAADVAALAGLDADVVRGAREALAQLRAVVEAALAEGGVVAMGDGDPTADGEAPSRADALEAALTVANEAFRRLRTQAEQDFNAAPDPVIAAVLNAHAGEVARLGVTVIRPQSPVPACIVDDVDLTNSLDNLVENALRAMEQAPIRRLILDWQPDGKSIAISVQDTGVGMTAAEAAAALEPGEGKRADGGRGLPASRQLLRKYGGSLTVGASAPGQGTTMVLHLRKATGAAQPATPGSIHEPERA